MLIVNITQRAIEWFCNHTRWHSLLICPQCHVQSLGNTILWHLPFIKQSKKLNDIKRTNVHCSMRILWHFFSQYICVKKKTKQSKNTSIHCSVSLSNLVIGGCLLQCDRHHYITSGSFSVPVLELRDSSSLAVADPACWLGSKTTCLVTASEGLWMILCGSCSRFGGFS